MGLDASAVEEPTMLIASPLRSAGFLLAFGVLSACSKPPASDESLPPEVILTGARLRSFRGNEVAATGRAAQVTYQRISADLTASEVLLRFPPRQGAGPSPALGVVEVRAPAVVGNRLTQQADGRDGVWVRTGSGMVGQTDRAHFDGVTMIATGNDPVTVDGPRYRVNASAFSLKLNAEEFSFMNKVSSRLGDER
jgi:lipopolysaccharide export system protein LptC